MRSQLQYVDGYLDDVGMLLSSLPRAAILDVVDALVTAYAYGRTIYVIGNGGSATTATHFACDLQKWTIAEGKPRVKAVALTDNIAVFSAWANDAGYEHVFREQLRTLVNRGDVVIAISGSGQSPNVLRAVEFAAGQGAVIVGLTGYAGGELLRLADHCIVVPSSRMNQIEDVHMVLCHLIADVVREKLSTELTSPAHLQHTKTYARIVETS